MTRPGVKLPMKSLSPNSNIASHPPRETEPSRYDFGLNPIYSILETLACVRIGFVHHFLIKSGVRSPLRRSDCDIHSGKDPLSDERSDGMR
jgi:hypothetical protein